MDLPVDITHPAWVTSAATLVGYSLILVLLTLTVFLIPFLFFWLL